MTNTLSASISHNADRLLRAKQKYLTRMLEDPKLRTTTYIVGDSKLHIVNARTILLEPEHAHQMWAKGIVISEKSGKLDIVSLSFPKMYNSNAAILQEDEKLSSIRRGENEEYFSLYTKKMDGTLINAFLYEGRVHFSTRSRIITLEEDAYWESLSNSPNNPTKNKDFSPIFFRNLVTKVLESGPFGDNYEEHIKRELSSGYTLHLELVGPSNVVMERHSEDSLVVLGVTHIQNGTVISQPALMCIYGFPGAAMPLPSTDLAEAIKAVTDGRDGVVEGIVEYIGNINEGYFITEYRIKHKTEDYLNAVRAARGLNMDTIEQLVVERGITSFTELIELLKTMDNADILDDLYPIYEDFWKHKGLDTLVMRIQSSWNQYEALTTHIKMKFLAVTAASGMEPKRAEVYREVSRVISTGVLPDIDKRIISSSMHTILGTKDITEEHYKASVYSIYTHTGEVPLAPLIEQAVVY